MKFAYSTLTLKAVQDGAKRILKGIATTPTPDRSGDVVEPKGAEFKLPIPFLWQHDSALPIGNVTKATVTAKGIDVEIEIDTPTADDPPSIVERLNAAWSDIKAGRVRGLSIGFKPKEYNLLDDGSYGIRFVKWLWLELSGVTIPANGDCSIVAIKSLDEAHRAASGRTVLPRLPGAPGSTGREASARSTTKGFTMKTIQQLREERQVKAARLTEIKAKMTADANTVTADEEDEVDTLLEDIKALDREIQMKRIDMIDIGGAKSVDGSSSEGAARSRGTDARNRPVIKTVDADDTFKGQGFIRALLAKAAAWKAMHDGDMPIRASDYAAKRWGNSHPGLVQWIKANEVPGGGTGSGEWGAELVGIDNRYRGDFVSFLYAMTVFDRLGLRPAPKNVSVKGQDGAAIGYWVGESKAIPVSRPDFSTTDLTLLKAAGITVASKELLADSDPAAEQLIRDSLGEAISQRVDTTFLSSTAGSAGVSPAGILNGVAPLHVSGSDEAAVRDMVKKLYSTFITDKNSSNLKLVMNTGMAKAVGLIVNALGQTSFPGLGTQGGNLLGDMVVTGDNVDPSTVLLIKPSDIWLLDEGLQVSMSDSAMIEQNSAPTGATDTPVAASQTMVSMFQEDSVAIKVVRRISYKKRRANAVTYVDDADFDGTVS